MILKHTNKLLSPDRDYRKLEATVYCKYSLKLCHTRDKSLQKKLNSMLTVTLTLDLEMLCTDRKKTSTSQPSQLECL